LEYLAATPDHVWLTPEHWRLLCLASILSRNAGPRMPVIISMLMYPPAPAVLEAVIQLARTTTTPFDRLEYQARLQELVIVPNEFYWPFVKQWPSSSGETHAMIGAPVLLSELGADALERIVPNPRVQRLSTGSRYGSGVLNDYSLADQADILRRLIVVAVGADCDTRQWRIARIQRVFDEECGDWYDTEQHRRVPFPAAKIKAALARRCAIREDFWQHVVEPVALALQARHSDKAGAPRKNRRAPGYALDDEDDERPRKRQRTDHEQYYCVFSFCVHSHGRGAGSEAAGRHPLREQRHDARVAGHVRVAVEA
jgi:hypothetical protein